MNTNIKSRIVKAVSSVIMPLILFPATSVFFSCAEDKGNYDYIEVPEITISGLKDSYTVTKGVGETFSLQPQVMTTGMESDLKYSWSLQTDLSPEINTTYLLGSEKNLTLSVDETNFFNNISKNVIVFRVTDVKTGIVAQKNIQINATSLSGEGFMLMCENKEGKAQLQFISIASDTVVIKNVLTEESGFGSLGKPVNVVGVGRYLLGGSYFWLMTEDDAWRFNQSFVKTPGSDFSANVYYTKESYNLGKCYPIDIYPHLWRTGLGGAGTYTTWLVVCNNGILFAGDTGFVNPLNLLDDEPGIMKAKPYIFSCSNINFRYCIYYDEINERFLLANMGSYNTEPNSSRLADNEGDIFPWNNKSVNRTLQFGQTTTNKDGGSTYGNSYALMRDKSNNDYYIYKFYQNYATNTKLDFYSVGQVATDLTRAEHYAFSSKRTALYYTVGSKLYGLDFNKGNEKVYLIRDFGEQITCMKTDDQVERDDDFIYIATYSDAKGGTFMKMQQGTNPDKLELNEVPGSKWTGLEKIVGWTWKGFFYEF